jgi:TonB family protein
LRKGRRIASTNDKITRLVITLDKAGELKRIKVKNASGYNDLDDAAIEAFRAAAPFPNPPNGIVNGEEEVEIPWDFVLET